MIKTKSFAFVILITTIILLVFGSQAITVQANNSEIATPTPTGVPAAASSNQSETASVEQEEEVKNFIQSYFEIRYRALSVAHSDDFKQHGFGNLVSDTSEAKPFLRTELAKLAVEIKHAELDHLRYVDYKYSLDFRNIAINPSTNTATVSVVEGNEIVYELSAELNPKNPIVSHTANIEHTIVLHEEQNQWKIVSDNYNDDLWRMLRQKGRSTDEILRTTDEMLRTMKASQRPTTQGNNAKSVPAYTVPDDSSSHPYDRAGAVTYALKHWSYDDGQYNPDYPNFSPDDCTNFISQAIYEGGNASMFIPSPLPDPSPNGQAGWYLLNDTQRASAWDDVGFFYTFVTSESWIEPYSPGGEYYGEGPEGYEVDDISQLMLGDVIEYDWEGDGTWDHAAIVVDFEADGTPYVAAHTTDHDHVPYTLPGWSKMRFIHIERSNGNPPVKAKIDRGSDDAGTNPTPCTFSSTDNEVYLGACFSGEDITSGFRFNNVQIPRNAKIKYAYLTFTVDGTYTVPVNVQIYGEATGNSSTFTLSNPPVNRPTSNGAALWNIVDEWVLGKRRTAPQLSSVIQEIVNRQDWDPGNSLSLIIKNAGSTNVRRVIAFERASWDSNLSPAKLIAAYSLEGLPTPTITPTATPTSTPTPVPPTPTATSTPTIAPTSPPPPTPAPCPCFLDYLFGKCSQANAQILTVVLQNLKNTADDLQLFYRVRDEILAQTPEGLRFIELYYNYSPEVIQLVQADPGLEAETRSLIQTWTPNLQALVNGNGDQVVITAEQVNATKNFTNHLSVNASPELKQAIAQTLAQHPLDPLVNKTMNEAWSYLNGYQLTWRPPLTTANPYIARTGSTIPVEFTLTDFHDNFIIDESVKLQVTDDNGNIVIGPISLGSNPNEGIVVQGHKYHYNLQTKGLNANIYILQVFYNSVVPNEPTVWMIQIKAK